MAPVLWGLVEHSAGGVVVCPDARVVLTTHRKKGPSFPKGHLKKGETSLQAAVREIGEEAGIAPQQLTLVGYLGTFFRRGKGLRLKRIDLYGFLTEQEHFDPPEKKHNAGALVWAAAYLSLYPHRPKDAEQILKHLLFIRQAGQMLDVRAGQGPPPSPPPQPMRLRPGQRAVPAVQTSKPAARVVAF
jgi:8-oxo-dGTP pyrophosphatase MutT (NUDIX family)